MELRYTCILFFLYATVFSQNTGLGGEPRPNEDVQLESFGYPIFFGGEQHGSFNLSYAINPKLKAELDTYYDTYLLSDRLRNNIRFKYYLNENWLISTGLERESMYNKYPEKKIIETLPPRWGFTIGTGYEVDKNFTLEARGNFQLNKTSMGVYGEYFVPMPQVYTVKGKIKF